MKAFNSLLFFLLLSVSSISQNKTLDYIDKYKSLAIEEMKLYNIPASIKLAQAILESASGTSKLSKNANNHFGIKCHSSWEGEKVFMDDDKKNECFRKYDSDIDSYRDHSIFCQTEEDILNSLIIVITENGLEDLKKQAMPQTRNMINY